MQLIITLLKCNHAIFSLCHQYYKATCHTMKADKALYQWLPTSHSQLDILKIETGQFQKLKTVTPVVIDHEILSTVICIVPLACTLAVPCESEGI